MAKPKKVNYELIPEKFREPHDLLEEAMEWDDELDGVSIALAWRKELKPDPDSHLILGKCMKVSGVYRELRDYDFIVLLNKEIWLDEEFTKDKKLALIDHELCHAAPALDKENEQKEDERGRKVWRSRKHDIEEFQDIVERHGCYKRDLEKFAETLLQKQRAPLLQSVAR